MTAWSACALAAEPAAAPASHPTELNNLGVLEARAGRFERAATYLRQAVQASPQDAKFRANLSAALTDWAALLERRGDADQAQALLEEAIAAEGGNGRAHVQLGDLLYFRRSQFEPAVESWKRAYGNISSLEWQWVSQRITQAQRDQAIERGFAALKTPHFVIRLQGQGQDLDDMKALARLLEQAYGALAAQLGDVPAQLTVIVYTAQDLQRLANRPDWAAGLYDGRLRLSLSELKTPLGPNMVSHELAHAFLHHRYGLGVPIWVHEGFAQQQEAPRTRSAREDALDRGLRERTQWVPLKWLDQRFLRPADEQDVARAYAQARLVVSELLARHGIGRFKTFLAQLALGRPVEEAFDGAFAPARWAKADQGVFD